MFTKSTRIILGIVQLSAVFWGIYEGQFTLALLFFGTILFNFLSFVRTGTVPLALLIIKKNNPKKAYNILIQTKWLNYLSLKNKSYYHFCFGYLKLAENNKKESLQFFKKSLELNGLNRKDWFICILNILDLCKKLNLKSDFQSFKDLLDRKDYFPEDLKAEYNRILN